MSNIEDKLVPIDDKNKYDTEWLENIYQNFKSNSAKELLDKIESITDFNDNTLDRVVVYPTKDREELESVYLKYMALSQDNRLESNDKAKKIFGKSNKEIYRFVRDNVVKDKNNGLINTHTVEDKKIEKKANYSSSLITNDLPMLTPKELTEKLSENFSIVKYENATLNKWLQEYILLGHGIKTEDYNMLNLERINILRRAIYENDEETIIRCGWIPGVEFNSENRVKASEIVREKMEVSDIIDYDMIEEAYVANKKDIYYNKDKFNSGEINLCFITGHSGSGKSTMSRNLSKKDNVEHYELDDIVCNDNFSDEKLKEYGELIYSFFKSTGKKYRNKTLEQLENDFSNYEKEIITDFVKYSLTYCKSHKNTKYVLEGIWLFWIIKPETLKDCAVYIKGTSAVVSLIRAAKRDFKESDKPLKSNIKWTIRRMFADTKNMRSFENNIEKYRKYFSERMTNESYIEEAANFKDKKAVSLIFVAGSSKLAKAIRKVQRTEFSHASISLDDDLSKIYSFNMRNGFNGLTYESVKNYIKEGVGKMGVYTFLVSEKVYNNLEKALEKFNLYIDKTKYSILNLLTIPINIPLDMDMKMVCSEFVDKLLKMGNLDLTNKKSSLIGPKDLIDAANSKSNIVEVYNGDPKKFNPKEIEKRIKKIKKSNLSIYEFVEYDNDEIITEAKSLPIQFDKDGNLILKNLRKINFEQEYADSHRLLKEYDKTKSYEPMKFELAKMQFFITLLEKKIYKKGKDKSVNELKVRARFLNDFKKYLKIVTTNDSNFNFTEYYKQSPFNDALIQIDKDTLKYGWKALKYIMIEDNF